jgi:hypothetical protein
MRPKLASATRAALRYPWAAALIPLGLAMGIGGLMQHAVRSVRRPAGSCPEGGQDSRGCADQGCTPESRGAR